MCTRYCRSGFLTSHNLGLDISVDSQIVATQIVATLMGTRKCHYYQNLHYMLRLWEINCLFFGPAYFNPKNSISVASKLGKTRQKILFWTTCFSRPFRKPSPSSSFLFQPLSSTFLFYFFVTIFCSALSFFTNFVKWEVTLEDRLGPIPLPRLILCQS